MALTWTGCSSPEEAVITDTTAPPVEAVQARRGGLPLSERLSGTIRADNQVVLYPEITGRIAEVFAEDGDTVKTGEPLVRVNDDQVREQVRQSEAGHRISAARLRQAQARLAEAEAQARRSAELNARNLVSDLEYETLAAQRESAAADVELAEAELEQAAAGLAERRDLLSKAIVRAPVNGIVGSRRAEVGMQASPAAPLFTLGDLSNLHVRVNLTDAMIGYIEVGQSANLIVEDFLGDTEPLAGRVARISPFLNEVTRSTEAEITITASDSRLRPGMFLPVDILYGESQQATLVPTSALFTDPNTGREGVFVLTGEPLDPAAVQQRPDALSAPRDVEFRPISVIARGAQEVAVAEVNATDWIVTLGQDLLSANARTQARARPVTWSHVMELQGLNREDLLLEVLEATGRDS
ncbi:efflux RND transporter periplasmic adaptor subunit [Synoicihabitans lomoniglobus]|nr:efflux RND transporter periplasmic adaptor subunit [Opitutaceae bacterium LMO-M01]